MIFLLVDISRIGNVRALMCFFDFYFPYLLMSVSLF